MKGARAPNSVNFLHFTRYRVLVIRCLLDDTIIFLKDRGFSFKVSYKEHTRKEPPLLLIYFYTTASCYQLAVLIESPVAMDVQVAMSNVSDWLFIHVTCLFIRKCYSSFEDN